MKAIKGEWQGKIGSDYSEFRRPSNQIEASTNCSKIAATGPDWASISSRSTCQRFGFLALNKAAIEQSSPKNLWSKSGWQFTPPKNPSSKGYISSFVACSEWKLTWGPRATGLRFLHWTVGSRHGPHRLSVATDVSHDGTLVGTLRPLADIGGRLLEERLQNNWRRSSSEAWWKKNAPVRFLSCLFFWCSYEVFIIHPVFPAAWVMQLCSQEVSQFVTHLQMKPTMKFSPGVLIFLIEQFVLGIWKALLDMFARRNGFGETSGNLGRNLRWFFAVKATATDADRLDVYWWVILAAEIQWWERWW